VESTKEKFAYFEGQIVPLEQANVNIQTHALQYGTGAFAGIRGYWNEQQKEIWLFRVRDHYQRLHNSARILMMKPPLSVDEMVDTTVELIRKNESEQNIYIRPILYKSALQLSPRLHDVQDDFAIYTLPLNDYLDTDGGLRCMVSSWRRISDNVIPTRAKATGGYINSALARSEADLNGFDEAIFLDENGYVSEGSAANLFIVRNGILITSPKTASILEGITRRSLLQLAQELNIPIEERDISRTELYVADEAFFAGTGVQMAWIKEIDYRVIGDGNKGEITKKLNELYYQIVRGESSTHSEWRTPVYRR
jgi:branched-chain amino acid aminotransferase